jgi:hypothetical protein
LPEDEAQAQQSYLEQVPSIVQAPLQSKTSLFQATFGHKRKFICVLFAIDNIAKKVFS